MHLQIITIIILSIIIAKYFTDISVEHNDTILHLFDEDIYKLAMLLIIIFISMYSIPIAILLIVGFSLLMINIPKLMENFNYKNGYISATYGPALNTCSNYPLEKTQEIGSAFYPMHTDNYKNY